MKEDSHDPSEKDMPDSGEDVAEVEMLARICQRFGATPPQDVLMARKMLQRAAQIALKRGINKLEALQYLLALMKNASEGDVAGNTALPKGSERSAELKKTNAQEENR